MAAAAAAAAAAARRGSSRRSPGAKSNAQFTADSREVFYLEGGRINVVNVESRQSRAINVTAELDVDFSKEKMEVFRQAWTYMRDGFYDEKFHGADWSEVRAQFTPIVAGVRTPDELRRVLNLMMGELNASHLGASGGGSAGGGQASNNGRLGLLVRSRRVRDRPAGCGDPRDAAGSGGHQQADQGRRLHRRGQRRRRRRRRRISTSS